MKQQSNTLSSLCADALRRLWPHVYADEAGLAAALEIVDRGVSAPPSGWRSLVSDDHTPVELSIAHSAAGPELRLLFEVSGESPTAMAQGRAARALDGWLRERFGLRYERLDSIAPLFLPDEHEGSFGLWHAAIFGRDGGQRFKVYLDPRARGRARAAELVEQALHELGLGAAWNSIAELASRGPALDELVFLSLDLDPAERARTKVYVAKHRSSVEELRAAARLARHTNDAALLAHLEATTGGSEGVLMAERPVVTCLDFVGDDPTPQHFTVHVPVRAYAPNDEEARRRALAAIDGAGHSSQSFGASLDAFSRRALSEGSGMIPYLSYRAEATAPRVTVYLSTEAMATHPPHEVVRPSLVPPPPSGSLVDRIQRFADESIALHPFFRRLAREPVSMERLGLLLRNFQHAITRDFARRLAQTVARVDDDALRSILAKQLNDELGSGDPSAAHALLFDRFVDGMASYVPNDEPEDVLFPGRRLHATLERIFVEEPGAYVGVGASLMMEVFGQQVDAFLGDQFRRQKELPPLVLEWLSLHEELEVDHVDEVFELARRVREGEPTSEALRGVQELSTAGWRLFDDMYRLAWPS